MTDIDITAYLARLGLPARTPSVGYLAQLHAAHVERIPFETLDRPSGVDPYESVARIVDERRGGVCYHLNGAFFLLLDALGYRVTMHAAGVQSRFNPNAPGANGTHNLLIVSDLPTAGNPDGRWIIDVGSGEGFHQPLPLRTGTHRQGDFFYQVRPSEVAADCWRVDYDPRESCRGVDFAEAEAKPEEFAETFDLLAGRDMSIFFVYGWAKRHRADGFDELIGCQLSAVGPAGRRSSTLTTSGEYLTALAEVFGLTLPLMSVEQRSDLWQRVSHTWATRDFKKDMRPDRH